MADNETPGTVIEVTDASFEAVVLKSTIPVVVDFWAAWCGPCKAIAPFLSKVATDYAGKITVVKMNVDDNGRTPSSYNIRGIPNFIFFKGGQVVDQVVGAAEEQLLAAVKKAIS